MMDYVRQPLRNHKLAKIVCAKSSMTKKPCTVFMLWCKCLGYALALRGAGGGDWV